VIIAIRAGRKDANVNANTNANPQSPQPGQRPPRNPGRWIRAALGRGLLFLGFWLLLSAPDLDALSGDPLAAAADIGIALAATLLAT